MKKLTLLLAASPIGLNAYADSKFCSTKDMNGSWVSYQGAIDATHAGVGACNLNFANGLTQGAYDFANGFTGEFKGEVVINKDCSATI